MAKTRSQTQPTKEQHQKQKKTTQNPEKSASWSVMKGFFTHKQQPPPPPPPSQPPQPHPQKKPITTQKKQKQTQVIEEATKKSKKLKCSGSLCSNTKVMQKPDQQQSTVSPETSTRKRAKSTQRSGSSSSSRSMKTPLREINNNTNSNNNNNNGGSVSSSSTSSAGGSSRAMQFRRFYGCYECRMVVDPVLGFTRDSSSLRTSICSCNQCGEIFMTSENLEIHQAVRHAVSELEAEDTSKNIVEIIFQSSWLKKQTPICKIDRILKIHNTQKTISKFEEYRDSIKSKATKLVKKHPRCIADGNELLRFHSTTINCSLGINGSSNLCNQIPNCRICGIIKNGFKIDHDPNWKGVLTTATSGKAHDNAEIRGDCCGGEKRAMLVCRVIAGKVKKKTTTENSGTMVATATTTAVEDYDSVAGAVGVYSDLDELFVFNPKAILPCFVVIYTTPES